MAMQAKSFNFETADLVRFIETVGGLNLAYRNRMLSILESEDNEMPRLANLVEKIVNIQEGSGVRIMSADFHEGFVKVFNMNASTAHQITITD